MSTRTPYLCVSNVEDAGPAQSHLLVPVERMDDPFVVQAHARPLERLWFGVVDVGPQRSHTCTLESLPSHSSAAAASWRGQSK